MMTTLDDSTSQLRTLIRFAGGGERPDWIIVPADAEDVTMRSGIAKVLNWLRAMSTSKRVRELTLTNQPWSEVVRCLANSSSFIQLSADQNAVALSETLSDEEKIVLCEVASEFRTRMMS